MNCKLNNIIDKKFCYFNSKIVVPIETYAINNLNINGNKKIEIFFEELKENIVKNVYDMSVSIYGIRKSLVTLTEFYCNPYFNSLRVKNNLLSFSNFTGELCIIGVWFSEKSYGPYIDCININYIDNCNLFIDNDSDEEINNYIKNI